MPVRSRAHRRAKNKDKRDDRAIRSLNTFSGILTDRREAEEKRRERELKFDKICARTGSPSIDHRK